MVLDTMTLEELIREIKTDFSEVKGRWKNYVRKFRKTAQKRTMFPWLWEANIKTRRFNEWYISFYAESKKEVGILNPTFTMLFKYKGQLLVGAVTNDVVLIFTGHFFDRYITSGLPIIAIKVSKSSWVSLRIASRSVSCMFSRLFIG